MPGTARQVQACQGVRVRDEATTDGPLEATIKPLKEKLHNIQMFVAFRTSEIESDLYKVHLSQKHSLLTNNTT